MLWYVLVALHVLTQAGFLAGFPGSLAPLGHEYHVFIPLALAAALRYMDLERFTRWIAWSLFLLLALGLLQTFGIAHGFPTRGRTLHAFYLLGLNSGAVRAYGGFPGPGTYALCMGMGSIMMLALALHDQARRRFLLLAAGAGAFGVVLALGRGAFLGMMVSWTLLLLLRSRARLSWRLGPVVLGGVLLFALALVSLPQVRSWLGKDASPVMLRVSRFLEESTFRYRFQLWRAGWRAVGQAPLWGHGVGNTEVILRNFPPGELDPAQSGPNPQGLDVHQGWLRVMVEMGGVGLLGFLVMQGAGFLWLLGCRQRGSPLQRGLILGALGTMVLAWVEGFFSSSFFNGMSQTIMMLHLGLGYGAALQSLRSETPLTKNLS